MTALWEVVEDEEGETCDIDEDEECGFVLLEETKEVKQRKFYPLQKMNYLHDKVLFDRTFVLPLLIYIYTMFFSPEVLSNEI